MKKEGNSEMNSMDSLDNRHGALSDWRAVAKRALVLFLPAFALAVGVAAAILFVSEKEEMATFRSVERHVVRMQALSMDEDVEGVAADLAILCNETIGVRLWNGNGKFGFMSLDHLAQQYLSFSTHRKMYDQVRLIDDHGMEIVRVNFNNGHPAVVPNENLQNKKGRYYFDDAFELSRGEVFVSPMDLNIERGEIEQPLKPMIRFATPIFDRSGKKRGIVLLNYFGAKLIERFDMQVDAVVGGQSMLLNADGYWLDGPVSEDEWGFMYEDRKDRTFSAKFPEAWEKIGDGESGQFEISQGLFTFRTVYPLLVGQTSSTGSGEAFAPSHTQLKKNDYYWRAVSFVPSKVLYAARNDRREVAAAILGLLALILFGGAWRMASTMALRKRAEGDRVRLMAAIDQAAESIVITDAEGIIEYVNPSFEQVTGYTRAEAIGQNPRILKSDEQDDAFYRAMWDTLTAGNIWTGRFSNRKKDGTLYTEDARISPVKDSEGRIVDYVAIKADITHELILDEQVRQMQKMESVGRLASGVAHEFNNILQRISGYCGLLLADMDSQSTQRQDVVEIQKASLYAGDLTQQLLSFSRKLPTEYKNIDLNTVLSDGIQMLRQALDDNFHLEFRPGSRLKLVNIDAAQILQIAMNLTVNARDAMPGGGTITLRTKNIEVKEKDRPDWPNSKTGDWICFSVSDTGCGMDEKQLAHLFDPFYTTKQVGEGAGLGLSVVYGIVEEHGGGVHVESEVGAGSVFRICLPAHNALEVGLSDSDAPLGKRILLVDDDSAVLELVTEILQGVGYVVLAAKGACEAEKLFASTDGAFDLLFIDVMLPDGDGVELASSLRKQRGGLPVLMFSGNSDDPTLEDRCKENGFGFIRKPFSLKKILEEVELMVSAPQRQEEAGLQPNPSHPSAGKEESDSSGM